MGDITNHEKDESLEDKGENAKNLKSSLKDEEEMLLTSLISKQNEIEKIRARIQWYDKMKNDPYFGKKAHGEIISAYDEIHMIKNEVGEILRNYLSPLSDEEKNHVAELMTQKWFANFVLDNMEHFWEIFIKGLVEALKKDKINRIDERVRNEIMKNRAKVIIGKWDYTEVLKNLDKFNGIDTKEIAKKIIERGPIDGSRFDKVDKSDNE